MSVPLELTIQDGGGTTHTYGDDRLLLETPVSQVESDDLDVRLGNIDIQLGPAAGTQKAEIAGVTDYTALPSETTWRAQLTNPSAGEIILDGAVLTKDLQWLDKKGTWRVRIINQAPKDFWDLCSRWAIPSLIWARPISRFASPDTKTIPILRRPAPSLENPVEPYFEEDQIVSELRQAVKFHLGRFQNDPYGDQEIDVQLPPGLPTGLDRIWHYRGRWKLDRLVDETMKLLGWRLQVTYQAFPSLNLKARFARTDWPTGTQPAIDSGQLSGGYRGEREEPGNFSVQLGNDPAEPSPDPNDFYKDLGSKANSTAPLVELAAPPAWAISAPRIWRADRPTTATSILSGDVPVSDPRTMNTDAETIRFEIAPMEIEGKESGAWYGKPLLPAETKPKFYGQKTSRFPQEGPQDRQAYVFSLTQTGNGPRALWGEDASSPTDLGHYAGGEWSNHAQRHAAANVANGEFRTSADFLVGIATDGVEFEGTPWLVSEERHDLSRDSKELTLKAPATSQASPGRPAPSIAIEWSVVKVFATFEVFDRGQGKEDWVFAHWERTPTRYAIELQYDVTLEDDTGTVVRSGQQLPTALTYQVKTAGNGGGSYVDDWFLRVTPVTPGATLGDERVIAFNENDQSVFS